MRRLQDIRIITDEIERVRMAMIQGAAITLDGHHGYIMHSEPNPGSLDTIVVILTHTGPPICACKEIPRTEEEDYS